MGFPIPDNLVGNTSDGGVDIRLLQLALPDDDYAPAFSLQLSPDLLIPFLVPCDLGHPELGIGLGDCIILTVLVAMPKTAVHEDNRPELWQYDIRAARKALVVYLVAKTLTP